MKGGLIKKGHNSIRDNDAALAEMAWGGVTIEPVLIPENDRTGHPALQADWMVGGVWEGVRVAFLTIALLTLTHPITSDPTSLGRQFPKDRPTKRRQSIVTSPKSCVE